MTHERNNARDRARRVGTEGIHGGMPSGITIGSTRPKPPQVTKAEQRAEADRAIAEWRATRASS